MNNKDRCSLGDLAKKCDEKKLEVEINKDFKVIAFKKYCKAKDFRKR